MGTVTVPALQSCVALQTRKEESPCWIIEQCPQGAFLDSLGCRHTLRVPPRPQYTITFLPFGSACFASAPKLIFRSVAVIANAVAITNLQNIGCEHQIQPRPGTKRTFFRTFIRFHVKLVHRHILRCLSCIVQNENLGPTDRISTALLQTERWRVMITHTWLI